MNLDVLPIKIATMAQDIQFLKDEVSEIKQLIKDHSREEREVWERFMNSKADKWTEKAVGVAIVGIVGAAATLVWAVVTKHIGA